MSNWNHTISIICLVYEGNHKYLNRFLEYTKRVSVNHEVVIVDNRDDKSYPLECSLQEAVLVSTEKNLGILDGRRFGFEHCFGDYVWFVDIDDEILGVEDTDYGNEDIICFSHQFNGLLNFLPTSRIIPEEEVCNSKTFKTITNLLWNKWISSSVLKKVYQSLPHFFCIYHEDNLITAKSLEFASAVRIIREHFAYNHLSNKDSITLRTITTQQQVDILFEGYEQINELNKDLKIELDPEKDVCISFYLALARDSLNVIKDYFLKKIMRVFSKYDVLFLINFKYPELIEYIPQECKGESINTELKNNISETLLSIIILFCDKDYQYLKGIIKDIKEKVRANYEIILIDNRDKEKDKKLDIGDSDVICYHFGYNAAQVQGRKKGIELANGKYIWFIDVDDNINDVDCSYLMDTDYDMIVFNSNRDFCFKGNLVDKNIYTEVYVALWNKWIKTDILKKVETLISPDLNGSASEDVMLVAGSLKYGNSIIFTKERIYEYNQNTSTWCCNSINDFATFQRLINGYDVVLDCMKKILSDKEIASLGVMDPVRDCANFLRRIAVCDYSIISQCIDLLSKYFHKEYIVRAWKQNLTISVYDKEKWIFTKNILQNKFPEKFDDFTYVSKRVHYKIIDGKRVFDKEEKVEILPPFFNQLKV